MQLLELSDSVRLIYRSLGVSAQYISTVIKYKRSGHIAAV